MTAAVEIRPVGRGRRIVVHGLILALVGGSLAAATSRTEMWPFSPYPMYSWVEQDDRVVRYALVGVTASAGREVPIDVMEELAPFDDPRLYTALWRLRAAASGEKRVDRALSDLMSHRERARLRGRHDAAVLRALRLYRYEWRRTSPTARDRDHPANRILLAETRPEAAS